MAKVVPETFNPIEDGNSPEYAKEQVLEGLSRLPMRVLTLMIQELAKVVPETFNPIEDGNSPEYAKEQVPFVKVANESSHSLNLFLVKIT